jgi:hypothetical protein
MELAMSLKLHVVKQAMSAGPLIVRPLPPKKVFSLSVADKPAGTRTELTMSFHCRQETSKTKGLVKLSILVFFSFL